MHRRIEFFIILLSIFLFCSTVRSDDTAPISPDVYEMLTYFFQYDRSPEMEARVLNKIEYEDHVREKIVFRSFRGDWVNGYIGIPKEGTSPYPCVLIPHGGSYYSAALWDQGDPRSFDILQNYIKDGYAVLALDAQYHGERQINTNYERIGELLNQKRYNQIRELYLDTVVDYRQALDYLETRTEIDPEKFAVHGYSMGGVIAFALTALDSRIKVCVACACPIFPNPAVVYSPYFFAHAIEDRPLLMLMGNEDPWYTVEVAQKTFDMIPSSTKQIQFFDSGHMLPREYEKIAHDWIVKYLK